jgi:diguanylate cyclase (GGDEF)-like protein
MLEQLTRVQRSISQRSPLNEVLDAITEGAATLLDERVVALSLVDVDDDSTVVLVSSAGVAGAQLDAIRRLPVGEGAVGQAISDDRLVVMEDYAHAPNALPPIAAHGLRAAMAAPVHENGKAVGSLAVGSYRDGRRYTPYERETLWAFAQQASVALNDARTVDALNRSFSDAVHQALHDSLTALPNRALLIDRLDHALARARRWGSAISVLFVDLDDFKVVNDSLGHRVGDQLLTEVADRLRRCIRSSDTAARLGGDEFAVLLEDAGDGLDATTVAERILDDLRRPSTVDGHDVLANASIGIAGTTSGTEEAGELLRNADMAMYRAKSQGKGRFAFFEPEMHTALLERLELEAEMRRGIEAGEFRLHYQPIVTVDDGRVVGLEALVRWQHPVRGMVPPASFIPLAEESGLIVPLGRWVLGEACRYLRAWQEETPPPTPVYVSVNVSAHQLHQIGYAREVAEVLEATGLDPASLVLEITESVFMQDSEATLEKLAELRAVGVRLALDDFGTGYSSIGYLRRFPIDVLKIDKSFVDALGTQTQDASLADAIVAMGAALNIETLAEGVEDADQHDRLRALGCNFAQGYLFARPLEPSVLTALLARSQGRLLSADAA